MINELQFFVRSDVRISEHCSSLQKAFFNFLFIKVVRYQIVMIFMAGGMVFAHIENLDRLFGMKCYFGP